MKTKKKTKPAKEQWAKGRKPKGKVPARKYPR